ncbi:MAG: HAMP domain-containing histidine kinase [Anaerolineae bacterium]|nr:HAMP domain-containing histidine kinase [Anaerolineae bacterium]
MLQAVLVDTAFEPLFLLDAQHRVVSANRAARALFPGADAIGKPIDALFDSPELLDLLACLHTDQGCPEGQFAADQNVYRARCNNLTADGEGYIALALQDITQLMRLNRARREMVANISHELRTPISAIRLLRDTLIYQKLGRKRRKTILRKIGKEVDALQRIIDGMHDLAMIESGQAIMRLIETPLAPLIHEALDHLDEEIERRKLEVTVDIAPKLYVLVDPGQIGRVLTNLIHNAVKFTPKGGRVHVHAEPAPAERYGEAVRVVICDSGPGIPPEDRLRVFERFYQRDPARSEGRGSGLGLSIAKHIVEAHNGEIWVEDSPLGGACLCFTLPDASPALNPNGHEDGEG